MQVSCSPICTLCLLDQALICACACLMKCIYIRHGLPVTCRHFAPASRQDALYIKIALLSEGCFLAVQGVRGLGLQTSHILSLAWRGYLIRAGARAALLVHDWGC